MQAPGFATRSNTTTALGDPTGRGEVYSGCAGRRLGGVGARRTSAVGAVAEWGTGAAPPATAAPPARSPGATRHPPFFAVCTRARHLQEGMRQQTEGDMPVPALPTPHFVLIEPDRLGALEALLDRPARSRHARQLRDRRLLRSKGPIEGHLRGIAERAAQQQPRRPVRRGVIRQAGTRPVVVARPLTTRPHHDPLPGLVWDLPDQGIDPHLHTAVPNHMRAGHGQDVRPLLAFQPTAQATVIAVDLIPRYPGRGHRRRKGARQHRLGHLALGSEANLQGDVRSLPARPVLSPDFGEIEGAIQKGLPVPAGVAQKDPDLTILDPASRTGILAGPPDRLGAFFSTGRV